VDIVGFLEARIAEEEARLLYADRSDSQLVGPLLAECAQKRAILNDWRGAAAAEGITDPADAQGPLAVARRAMLAIVAAGYKNHPDYSGAWVDEVPNGTAAENQTGRA
jgi:hypothetical protein